MDIKALLRDRGLKQRDLARALGVSEGRVSQWVAGNERIPAERAPAFAEALGLALHDVRPDIFRAPET